MKNRLPPWRVDVQEVMVAERLIVRYYDDEAAKQFEESDDGKCRLRPSLYETQEQVAVRLACQASGRMYTKATKIAAQWCWLVEGDDHETTE